MHTQHTYSLYSCREDMRRQTASRASRGRAGPSVPLEENELYESPDPMTDAERDALESESGMAT
jgi:hypothetical protein